MAATREQFSGRAAPELLAAIREIARQESRDFEAVLEEALWEYLAQWANKGAQPEAEKHTHKELKAEEYSELLEDFLIAREAEREYNTRGVEGSIPYTEYRNRRLGTNP